MKLRAEQLDIPLEKITEYLLAKKEKNDKSKFLQSLGYSLKNWQDLLMEIKNIALKNDMVLERRSVFGNLYSIRGKLKNKLIITIWLKQVNKDIYRFITLYPVYEK
ncbi:MAG: hypothetical protein M3004_04535 [Bacteroidota bacterium]|nr:hypothetical protein [Bacteroidota bacterium]